jgi:hypothetical protein
LSISSQRSQWLVALIPMADLEGATQVPESGEDVEMEAGEEIVEEGDEDAAGEDPEETAVATINPQTIFLDYLRSPVVKLDIGKGEEQTTLSAHRAILERSPYFMSKLASLAPNKLTLSFPEE